jgi:hypothetical protein
MKKRNVLDVILRILLSLVVFINPVSFLILSVLIPGFNQLLENNLVSVLFATIIYDVVVITANIINVFVIAKKEERDYQKEKFKERLN